MEGAEIMIKDIETHPYDAAEFITTEEDAVATLEAAFEDGDPAVIAKMLGAVARSHGMTEIAKRAGKSREALYKALSADGNPTLSTLVAVLESLGLRLAVVPLGPKAA